MMPVEDGGHSDSDSEQRVPDPGADFRTDLYRVGNVVRDVLVDLEAQEDVNTDEIQRDAAELGANLSDRLVAGDESLTEDQAVLAAWFFILSKTL